MEARLNVTRRSAFRADEDEDEDGTRLRARGESRIGNDDAVKKTR